jgi:argininosuccinate lyase
MTFHVDVASLAAGDEYLVAIDVAEELVAEGVPFRRAHEQVGKLVAESVRSGRSLRDVVARSSLTRFDVLFDEGTAIARRRSPGGSGPASRDSQLRAIRISRDALRQRFI